MSDAATVSARKARARSGSSSRRDPIGDGVKWLDERLGIAKGGRTFLDKIFPDHWSFLLGEIALYSFVVLLSTGIFLSLYYVPSASEVIYHGVYKPLDGVKMSAAYASSVDLSFVVRGGLVIRQMHHWAADVFIGSIAIHMCRIFFTGAYRKPRELNWIIGVTLLMLAIINGFLGYSLPDDLVSGTGIRLAFSFILSIPVIGSYLAFFLFGGNYPGSGIIIPRFFIIHVLILPLVILGLIAAHLGLLVRQKHTQFPGHGRTEQNVVGSPMYPTFILKTTGFLFMISGAPVGARGPRPGQPDLAVRPLRAVQDQLRRATGLVHGLARRGASHHALRGSSRASGTRSRSRCSCRPSCSRGSPSPCSGCGPSSPPRSRATAPSIIFSIDLATARGTQRSGRPHWPSTSPFSAPVPPTCSPTSSRCRSTT